MPELHHHREHTRLGIRIDYYHLAVGQSINDDLVGLLLPYVPDDQPVFTPSIRLEVAGTCICPDSRADESYEITIVGEDVDRLEPKVEDIRVRDKDNHPIYRKGWRGRDVPAYKLPAGFATLKLNPMGEEWRAFIWVSTQSASHMIAGLTQFPSRPIYLAMCEHIHEGERWIDSFYVQTRNPADE